LRGKSRTNWECDRRGDQQVSATVGPNPAVVLVTP